MLKLINICKDYPSADETVHALRGVSLNFRRSEFVSILGPSGCGKTTLLNIVGGLDRYTDGDLMIRGRSTKEYKDRDWDTYRNHSVGFVFQNYNLIPHQTVLSNVELALTLSGVGKEERRRRAKEALERVGLGDQIHKKPNQMSGGQMQRVAIARALVNDPDILLADEPTGALDTKTSVQVMELLKEIASDRLVIMVTHNPELAQEYSTRIIRLKDGEVVDDTMPYSGDHTAPAEAEGSAPAQKKKDRQKRLRSMSFLTALSLSLNNLMTKKARTFLTSFAGSIGIIGIALILSLSNGIQVFIDQMQEDTLSSYPIDLSAEQLDMSALLSSLMGSNEGKEEHELDKVYSNVVMYEMMEKMINAEKTTNNLKKFKEFLDSPDSNIRKLASAIQFGYGLDMFVYTDDEKTGEVVRVDGDEVFTSAMGGFSSSSASSMNSYSSLLSSSGGMKLWQELLSGKEDEQGNRAPVSSLVLEQYDLVAGDWPTSMNEVVLVVNSKNEISDTVLYALGLKDRSELPALMASILAGKPVESEVESWEYQDILNKEFRLCLPTDFYTKPSPDSPWIDVRELDDDNLALDMVVGDGLPLRISGIIRPNPDATATSLSGSLGYTYLLTDYVIENVMQADIVKEQMDPDNANIDVLTGLPFEITAEEELSDLQKRAEFRKYVESLSEEEKMKLFLEISTTPEEAFLDSQVDSMMKMLFGKADGEGYDREKMEKTILDRMGDNALVQSYVAKLSDGELADLLKETMRTMLAEQYKTAAEKQLESTFVNTVVATVWNSVSQNPMLQIGYLANTYSAETGIPADQFMSYLASLAPADLEAKVKAEAKKQGEAALLEGSAYRTFCAEALLARIDSATDADAAKLYDGFMPSTVSESTLADNLKAFGVVDHNDPTSIVIYASTFDNKEAISAEIARYNEMQSEDEDKISYTDYVKIFVSSITILVDAVSYVLIAFVSISLVVSSIMIGIITYISVLERTKEIGVLRSVGASKGDVARVFNAETLIVGLVAGLIGIGITVILCFPINAIIAALSGVSSIKAVLPIGGAIILVVLSMGLTLIAGLFPSLIAAKKDPVVALRSE